MLELLLHNIHFKTIFRIVNGTNEQTLTSHRILLGLSWTKSESFLQSYSSGMQYVGYCNGSAKV